MNRLFSTFDPTELGASMALEQANTIVATTGIASINRMVKALYGKSSSQWFAEFAFYGDEPLTGAVSVGIASETSPLTGYVGEDANSYGYRAGDGEIHNNGSSIASVATAVAGDIIGVLVNIGDGTAASVTWFLNGEVLHTESIAGGVWFLAATVKTATSDPMRAWINTGQRDFEYPVPGIDGWFDLAEDVPAVLVSTEDYISPTTDTLPNAVWEGMIADDGVEIVSEVKFWVDGDVKMARGSATSVQVAHNGEFDWLLAANTRDVPALLQTVDRRGSFDSAETVATMIVNDVQAMDQGTIRFNLTTTMSQFDRPLQTKIFPPSADIAVAGKPWPIALGAARQVTPVLVDPANRIYALTDRGIVGIGYVRDKGAPLDPGALPPGYVIGTDFRTIVLETNPEGKLTADVSNQGGSVPPTLSDDIWDGDGNPFTGSIGSPPNNFDVVSNAEIGPPARLVMTVSGLSATARIGKSAVTCVQGRSYRYHVDIQSIPGAHAYGRPSISISTAGGYPQVAFTAPGIYEGIITALGNFVPHLSFQDALGGSEAVVNSIYILEIPDTYDPAEIQPITFTDFMREIVEVRANMPPSAWSLDDAQAIDTDTGYTGVGFFESGSLTVRGAIDSIMSSYTACAYNDEDDVLRFTRLLDPAGETPVGEITEDDLLAELTCKNDLAPGLSTQMHFRKNWTAMNETDFVSDFITVPGEVRRALTEPYQGIVASALPLPGMYRHAIYASPIGTLLDNEEDAQAEIDRIVGYYGVPRFFYTVEVSDEDFPAELGEVWTLTSSRYELTAGKPLQVCKVIRRPIAGTRQITLRG